MWWLMAPKWRLGARSHIHPLAIIRESINRKRWPRFAAALLFPSAALFLPSRGKYRGGRECIPLWPGGLGRQRD